MIEEQKGKRAVTAKRAIEMLKNKGITVTDKEVEDILYIMYFLAKLIVRDNFKK